MAQRYEQEADLDAGEDRPEGNWPAGQHGPVRQPGFERAYEGAPREERNPRYRGQSAYGGLQRDDAGPEHAHVDRRRSAGGQDGAYGEGTYGGAGGDAGRGGLSSYGNSSGSRYGVDNEFAGTARTTDSRTARDSFGEARPGRAFTRAVSGGDETQRFAPQGTHRGAFAGEYSEDLYIGDDRNALPPVHRDRLWPSPLRPRSEPPKGYIRSSERIREEICERLMEHGRLELRDVSVAVHEGVVTLEGTVPIRAMKHTIEDVADNVSGVIDIENHLRVRRADSEATTFATGYTQGQSYANATSGASGQSGEAHKDETPGAPAVKKS